MRINHNVSSSATQGTLFKANRSLNGNLEKLSTGLRINRASDDATGLSNSDQFIPQIRGAGQAYKNAQDGIAALKIGEGALSDVSSVLKRMRELAKNAEESVTASGAKANEFAFDDASKSVSNIRATIDKQMEHLDQKMNTLLVRETNQQAAESQIRDMNFANESSHFAANQIESQSKTAVLAQSNGIPQTILSLLQ